MRQLAAVLAVVAAGLAAAGTALAGGWATVGVDPLPSGVGPGDTWKTDITFLQHAQTPLTGIHPTVTISDPETGATHTYAATETTRPGVYEASVVFPEAGGWNVAVESDWWGEARLTFGPVTIGGSPVADGSPGFPVVPAAVVVALLLAAAAGAFGVARLRRLSPAR